MPLIRFRREEEGRQGVWVEKWEERDRKRKRERETLVGLWTPLKTAPAGIFRRELLLLLPPASFAVYHLARLRISSRARSRVCVRATHRRTWDIRI